MSFGMQGNKIPKGYELGRISNFNPQQKKLFSSLFSHVGPDSFLSRLSEGDEDIFNEIEAPAFRQLQQLQGGLASRFSGAAPGQMSSRRGSGHRNAQNQLLSDFAMGLQSQRHELTSQALRDLMGMSNQLLNQRPYENFLSQKPEKQDFLSQILGGLSSGIPGALAQYFG
jgi:hypothetical protein